MPALPILKLPITVLMKILRTIDIEEVIPMSLSSRKMYHLVKNFRDKTDILRLKVYGEEGSSVGIVTPDYSYHGVRVVVGKKEKSGIIERVNINGHLVPIDRSRKLHVWNTYWNDREKGIQSVMESAIEYPTFSAGDHLITRNDGVVASFRYDPMWDVFDYVQFGVWPGPEGNEY